MADAIPPTSPTPVTRPPDTLGGTTVNVGSNAGDLQTAITAALNADGTHKGNTLVVPAGVTYTPVVFPVTTGSGWTCITTDSATLPAGTRATSADTAKMFKVRSTTSGQLAVSIPAGSNGWRLIGMEADTTLFAFGVVQIEGSRISLERCYTHGAAAEDCVRSVFVLNASDVQIWDSSCYGKYRSNDAQAIYWRNTTRTHVENCYLEGTGENMMLGDQGADAPCLDMTIRRCTFFKPLTWRRFLANGSANGTWDGVLWVIKNLFEIKWAQRVLLEGNVFENCWPQGQDGTAILYNVGVPEESFFAHKRLNASDVMFRHNTVKNAQYGVSVSTNSPQTGAAVIPTRCAFTNNLFLQIGGRAVLFNHAGIDLALYHNTVVPQDLVNVASWAGFSGTGTFFLDWFTTTAFPRHTLKYNVFGPSSGGFAFSARAATTATLDEILADRAWSTNAIFGMAATSAMADVTHYASAATAGIDTLSGILTAQSPLAGTADAGSDVGVNFTTLAAAQTGDYVPGDTTAPTTPTNLSNATPLSTSYTLTWTASTDDVAVAGYEVEVTPPGSTASVLFTTGTSIDVTGLRASTTYGNRVRAVDTSGNRSAYTANRDVATAAGTSATAAPPDLMRGFGPTRGVAATDQITLGLTAHNASRTYMFWTRRQGASGVAGDTCYVHKATALADAFDENLFQFGDNMVYQRKWSTGQGEWVWPGLLADGQRHCVIIRYDGSSASNHPVVKIDDVLQTVTRTQTPSGSIVTNSNPYVLGNYQAVAPSYLNGDLAKFAVFNFISTDANDVAFFEGTDPTTIGAGAVGLWLLNGTANEPDTGSGASGNSTIAGTQVQSYAAAPSTTVVLAISSGDPVTGGNWNATATTSGTVDRVEFWVDGSLSRTDSAAPYTLFASDSTLGAGAHTIEARVFAAAGGSPADIDTIAVTEGVAAPSDAWTVTFTWERDAAASGGYKFYVDGVAVATVAQPPVEGTPTYTTTFSGNDTTRSFDVSPLYAGGVEGPKTRLIRRYKATATSGTKPIQGFQEVARSYTP